MVARADLHAHSRYSDQPNEWLLRRLGAPECFTEPLELYRRCRAVGMDFVTITDHDSIEGALEIAHLPGAFVSCEVTAAFPDDGCPVHVLVWGIDERQHWAIQERRRDLYALVDYLAEEAVVHALAHPLFRQSDRLTVGHFERLLLLFQRFEQINGSRAPRGGELLTALLAELTPQLMAHLAERHDLAPRHGEPWVKHTTGGSDDHAGLYLGRAWTETPPASSPLEFLEHVAAGRSRAAGEHGSSSLLARCFTGIACQYYRRRLEAGDGWDEPLSLLLERFVAEGGVGGLPLGDRIRLFAAGWLKPRRTMEGVDRALVEELVALATKVSGPAAEAEERCFRVASRLADHLAYGALRKFGKYVARGRLSESLQSLSALGPAAVCAAPYVAAFRSQHQDAGFHREVEARFGVPARLGEKSEVWFADASARGADEDLAASLALLARGRCRRLVRLACQTSPAESAFVVAFAPLGTLELPELEGLVVSFPPTLAMLAECERRDPAAILVDDLGPTGLVGMAAAGVLGVPLLAVYREGAVQRWSPRGSATLGDLAVRAVRWFYGRAQVVYAAGEGATRELAGLALDGPDLRALPLARRRPAYAALTCSRM